MRLPTVLLAALLVAFTPAAAQTFPERNRAALVDAAGVIADAEEERLNAEIVAWNRATGHQLVVATVPSLEGRDIADYGNRLFRHWRLGQAEANDGVLLLLAPAERTVRIEVGYGLEGVLTDTLTSAIIRETIRPALAKDDIAGALGDGIRRIMTAAGPETDAFADAGPLPLIKSGAPLREEGPSAARPSEAQPPAASSFPWGELIFLLVAIFGPIILTFHIRRKRRRARGDEPTQVPVPPRGDTAVCLSRGTDALAALTARAAQDSSPSSWSSSSDSDNSWDSPSSSSPSDSGFDSGGGSSGGGGSDSNY